MFVFSYFQFLFICFLLLFFEMCSFFHVFFTCFMFSKHWYIGLLYKMGNASQSAWKLLHFGILSQLHGGDVHAQPLQNQNHIPTRNKVSTQFYMLAMSLILQSPSLHREERRWIWTGCISDDCPQKDEAVSWLTALVARKAVWKWLTCFPLFSKFKKHNKNIQKQ